MKLLTIAGHDPVHGAGLTADLAMWRSMGLPGASVVTALTLQNSQGLARVEPIDARIVREALRAVLADGEPSAIKIGLLGSAAVAREVSAFVAARACPVVVDPGEAEVGEGQGPQPVEGVVGGGRPAGDVLEQLSQPGVGHGVT